MSEAQLSGCVILQLIPSLGLGGAERVCIDAAKAIVAAGGRALVGSAGGVLANQIQEAGGEVLSFPRLPNKNPLAWLGNAWMLARLLVEYRVDVIHAHSRAPAWSALAAARYRGIPFITTFHSAYHARSPLKKLYNSVMARGERVIAVSHFIAGHIRTHYPKAAARVSLVSPGIDLDYFSPNSVTAARLERLRNDFKLNPNLPLLVIPGRLVRQKGQWSVVESLSVLQRPEVQCVMVGPSKSRERQRLQLQAEQLGVQIRIPGSGLDMPALYLLADVVVIPSVTAEGFGLAAAEALAMGRPVIASELGALPEAIGQAGWLTPPADPEQLAQILARVLDLSLPERAELAVKAREHIESSYSLRAMQEQTVAIYQELWHAGRATVG